jgi:hypothetical protein
LHKLAARFRGKAVPALARRSLVQRCRRSPFFATAGLTDLAELFDAVVGGPRPTPRKIGVN